MTGQYLSAPLQAPSLSWDDQARASCARLSAAFGLPPPSFPAGEGLAGAPSLGAEIEIPWSGYFPELWERFEMSKGVNALSPKRRDELSAACAKLEVDLLPKLELSAACGVPRGNDRYWEFAFNPVSDWRLLLLQTQALERAGVLPNNGRRSLQLTIAGIEQGPQAQALERLLEAYGSSAERLKEGIERSKAEFYVGWARKGSGGVLQKGADKLLGGARVACEFRALSLPSDPLGFERLLSAASTGARAIIQGGEGLAGELAEGFHAFQGLCEGELARVGASSLSWETGARPDYAAWAAYTDRFEEISSALRGHWERLGLDRSFAFQSGSSTVELAAPRYNKGSF